MLEKLTQYENRVLMNQMTLTKSLLNATEEFYWSKKFNNFLQHTEKVVQMLLRMGIHLVFFIVVKEDQEILTYL